LKPLSINGLFHPGFVGAYCLDSWLRTGRYRVRSLAWAKSLTPGFTLIDNFFEMINPVRIDYCAEA